MLKFKKLICVLLSVPMIISAVPLSATESESGESEVDSSASPSLTFIVDLDYLDISGYERENGELYPHITVTPSSYDKDGTPNWGDLSAVLNPDLSSVGYEVILWSEISSEYVNTDDWSIDYENATILENLDTDNLPTEGEHYYVSGWTSTAYAKFDLGYDNTDDDYPFSIQAAWYDSDDEGNLIVVWDYYRSYYWGMYEDLFTPVRSGYIFAGWFDDDGNELSFDGVDADNAPAFPNEYGTTVYTAKWRTISKVLELSNEGTLAEAMEESDEVVEQIAELEEQVLANSNITTEVNTDEALEAFGEDPASAVGLALNADDNDSSVVLTIAEADSEENVASALESSENYDEETDTAVSFTIRGSSIVFVVSSLSDFVIYGPTEAGNSGDTTTVNPYKPSVIPVIIPSVTNTTTDDTSNDIGDDDNGDTVTVDEPTESNPKTGAAFAILPMAIAALAAVETKRR